MENTENCRTRALTKTRRSALLVMPAVKRKRRQNIMLPVNLNDLTIPDDGDRDHWRKLSDNSTTSSDGSVTVHFRDLEQHLLGHIRKAKMVVGCVAWMTSERILHALSQVSDGVSIVIQKEDFLRPDLNSRDNWKAVLRRQYNSLKPPAERHLFDGLVGSLSCCSDPTIQPVRCIGNHNRDKKPAFPRMHNKFLVFCDIFDEEPELDSRFEVKPHTVWTGSFNLTKNAAMSLENALVLTDSGIIQAYYREWEQILAISERLDWCTDWCEPEWRIGS